jgi:uncharacterized protein YdaU (DUF1376 family)
MFYYQHHIGDFIKDTSNLDDHQLATYLRMLWSYYTSEKQLTSNIDDIAFAVRSDEKTVRLLLRHFFNETEEGWSHNRCDREISEYHKKSEKARNSANARWSNANVMRTHTERNANAKKNNANQEPITNNQEPNKKATVVATPDGVSESVWQDFVKHRKSKKAQVTQTVVDRINKEAQLAGWSLEQALTEVVVRNWQSFKAEWVIQKMTAAEQRLNTMHQLTGGITTPKNFWDKPTVIEVQDVERKRLL